MIINQKKPEQDIDQVYHIGRMVVERTNKYKYLGLIINEDGNLKDHIQEIKKKTEAAYESTISICQNNLFRGIEMATTCIWKLYETCLQPLITYGLETWPIKKSELIEIEKIQEHLIKRFLMTPYQTPSEAIYYETGLMNIENLIYRNRILMKERLGKKQINLVNKTIEINGKNSWQTTADDLSKKLGVERNRNRPTKIPIRNKLKLNQYETLKKSSMYKSKINHLKNNVINYKNERKEYINVLNRKQASLIFTLKAKSRMLEVKNNFKENFKKDPSCRKCLIHLETQEHIFNTCPAIHLNNEYKISNNEIFNEDIPALKNTAEKIEKIFKILQDKN